MAPRGGRLPPRQRPPGRLAGRGPAVALGLSSDELFPPPSAVAPLAAAPPPTKLQGAWGNRAAISAVREAPTAAVVKPLLLRPEAAAALRAEVEAELGKKGKVASAASAGAKEKGPAPAPYQKPKPQANVMLSDLFSMAFAPKKKGAAPETGKGGKAAPITLSAVHRQVKE